MIRIITDTSAALDPAFAEEHDILILPLRIMQEDIEYRDTIDITPIELYRRMREGERFTTAQLSLKDLMESFERFAQAGDDVIFMPLSPGISGTYATATIMAQEFMEKYPGRKIGVVYTRSTTGGLYLQVLEAVREIEAGTPFDEIMKRLEAYARHTHHFFTVDELSYFYRGGRLTALETAAGTILSVKPILSIDKEGHLMATEKVRGRHKAIARVADLVGEHMTSVEDIKTNPMVILHTDIPEAGRELETHLRELYGATGIITMILPAIIGVHTGPTLVAVCYIDETAAKRELGIL